MNRRILRLLNVASMLLLACSPSSARAQSPRPLVLRDVTVIDCTGSAPRPGMSVVVVDGRIAAIGPSSQVTAPAHAEILDGRGKYLVPGLWNMHVHLGDYASGTRAINAWLSQGVTGLRDMGSPLDDILRLRHACESGPFRGVHLMLCGPIIQGPLPFRMPLFTSVRDTNEARQTVARLRRRGVAFIKIQDAIPHDIYVAVATEASREGIPFVGHIPPTVWPEEACDLGQRSIEHLGGRFWGVLLGCSTLETALHAREAQMYAASLAALESGGAPPDSNMRAPFTRTIVESYDAKKAAALVERFRAKHTWQCPTLVALPTLWAESATPYTAEDMQWADRIIAKDRDLVAMMQRAGVGLLAGTDLPPDAKAGTIHDELAALVDAGLTPMQALETATRLPAEFFGTSSCLGTIEPGKIADLLLLDGDPLADIHYTRDIKMVILRGRVVPRP